VRVTRRVALALLVLLTSSARPATQSAPLDILIRGGQVVDGTGAPPVRADVAIRAGRIVEMGALEGRVAARTIDAGGLTVAPGFIDLHTHSEMPLLADGKAESKVRQGVTLDVMGESTSVAPRDGLNADGATPGNLGGEGVTPDWTTFTGYFDRLERQGTSINVISHVASEQVRRVVMGFDTRPANAQQRARMKELVARSMEEGAWGLVTRFESGGPEHPDEVMEMAKVVASYGGNYTSHTGSEGFEQEQEFNYAIRVAREARLPVHIFHFKVRARQNWGTIGRYIRQLETARTEGLDITANQYPYTAMFHGWNAFFPLWIREGGPAEFASRLKDPAARARLKKDKDFETWAREHGWWDGIVMARAATPANQKYEGMRISEIAKLRGDADPMDTCINLMAEEGGRISGIFHTMSEDDVRAVMKLPWVAIASDGSAINLQAPGVPHPRNYSTNARVLGHYVRDERVLTLPDAVRKMTSLPASILGLKDRGLLKAGFAADVVLFDAARVKATNSFEKPKSYVEGVPYVLVNGVVVIDNGQHTGAKPGKALRGAGARRGPPTSSSLTTVFPGAEWERVASPEQAGFSKPRLDAAIAKAGTMATTSIVAVAGGRILADYGDTTHLSYIASVRKSVLAMLFGNYVASGKLRLDKTLGELKITDHGGLSPQESEATIEDLLGARSGVYHVASYSGDDLASAPPRNSQRHGTYYLYSNWDFNALGTIFEQETGRDIYDALETDLARPIGMQDFRRDLQKKEGDLTKSVHAAYPMWFSTRDMARIGYLMLRDGNWAGTQIVPRDWARRIAAVRTPLAEMNPANRRAGRFGYGYLWWVFDGEHARGPYEGAYTGIGAGGQYITVVPKLDLVVAHKTDFRGGKPTVSTDQYLALVDGIVAAYCGGSCSTSVQ
jgi:N-acyl-D-aspartate/D-glutamate deacylase/CubicO group peptidase (beta-lactamase class C family)